MGQIPNNVILRTAYPNELMHSAGPWKEHKYVSKHKGKNGKWVYVYKAAEISSSTHGVGLIANIVKGSKKASEDIPQAVAEAKASKPKTETKPKRIEGATYALTDKDVDPKSVKTPDWLKKPSKKKSTRVALAHSAKGTSWEKKDHKYKAKYIKNGKTYYKYDSKSKLYTKYDITDDDVNPHNAKEALLYGTGTSMNSNMKRLLNAHGIYEESQFKQNGGNLILDAQSKGIKPRNNQRILNRYRRVKK